MSAGKGKGAANPANGLTGLGHEAGVVATPFVGSKHMQHAVADNLVDESRAGAAKKLDAAIGKIYEAQKLNDDMQRQYSPGTASWHQCESIDDRLHDALALLGD